jgi:hypothetical protein
MPETTQSQRICHFIAGARDRDYPVDVLDEAR